MVENSLTLSLCVKKKKKQICNLSGGSSTNSLVTDSFAHPFPPNIVVYMTKLLRLNRRHLCLFKGVYLHRNSAPSPPPPPPLLPTYILFFFQSGWASQWRVCYQRGLPCQTRYFDLSLYLVHYKHK